MGARGLWLGLSAALVVAGVVLLMRWKGKKI
jgi:Na+-driven multidrug efflux pump